MNNPEVTPDEAITTCVNFSYSFNPPDLQATRDEDWQFHDHIDANAHFGKGNELLRLGFIEEALTSFDEAIKLNPLVPNYFGGRGDSLWKLGRYSEGVAAYESAINIGTNDYRDFNGLGNCLRALGSVSRALDAYEHAILLNTDSLFSHQGRGNCLRSLGRYEEAVVAYMTVIGLDSAYFHAYQEQGNALFECSRYQEALNAYELAVRINPGLAVAHEGMGDALLALGRKEEAIGSYARSIELNTGSASAHKGMGNALWSLGRDEEAIGSYARSIELDPGSASAHSGMGNTLWSLGRNEEAIGSYARASELDPGSAFAHNGMGNTLWALGRNEEAIGSYARSIELDATSAFAPSGKGDALWALGRNQEAIASYANSIHLDPGYSSAHNGMGNALVALGRHTDAEKAYNEAIRLSPSTPMYWLNKGDLFLGSEVLNPFEGQACLLRGIHLLLERAPSHDSKLIVQALKILRKTNLPLIARRLEGRLGGVHLFFEGRGVTSDLKSSASHALLLLELVERNFPEESLEVFHLRGLINFFWGDVFTARDSFHAAIERFGGDPLSHWFLRRCLASYCEPVPQSMESAAIASALRCSTSPASGEECFYSGSILDASDMADEARQTYWNGVGYFPCLLMLWSQLDGAGEKEEARAMAQLVIEAEESDLRNGREGYLAGYGAMPVFEQIDENGCGTEWIPQFLRFVVLDELFFEVADFIDRYEDDSELGDRVKGLHPQVGAPFKNKYNYSKRLANWRLRGQVEKFFEERAKRVASVEIEAEKRRLRSFMSNAGLLRVTNAFEFGEVVFTHHRDKSRSKMFRDAALLFLAEQKITAADFAALSFYISYVVALRTGSLVSASDVAASGSEMSIETFLLPLEAEPLAFFLGGGMLKFGLSIIRKMVASGGGGALVLRFPEFHEEFTESLTTAGLDAEQSGLL